MEDYKKKNLTERLAKLKEGVAIIKVGFVTEEASREKQYRIEDAVNATKSAIEEGVVKGGGMVIGIIISITIVNSAKFKIYYIVNSMVIY